MAEFIFTYESTRAFVLPTCSTCGTPMVLDRLTSDSAGSQRTFECPGCDRTDLEVVSFN
jgi:hypothetical protein